MQIYEFICNGVKRFGPAYNYEGVKMDDLTDNGHGRETAGKHSPDGRLLEWAYNREIARRVVAALSSLGLDAELLVPEDEDISLKERCRRVNTLCSQLGKRNVAL